MNRVSMEHDHELAEILRRLVDACQPYGSIYSARWRAATRMRTATTDLMLVVPDDASPERRDSDLAYEVLRGTGRTADVLVWTPTPVRPADACRGVVARDDSSRGSVAACRMIRNSSRKR